jgi:hypothetical protein
LNAGIFATDDEAMADTVEDDMTEDFYEDPAHLVPAGPARRRQRPIMSEMVPVRFPREMIAAVRRLADFDGLTVSSWIRRLVAKEIKRREPPVTVTGSAGQSPGIQIQDDASLPTSTAPAVEPSVLSIAC